VEQFVLDYARYPELPGDGPAHWVLLRRRAANLAEARRQPWESERAEAWRRRTAALVLFRTARVSMVGQRVARHMAAKLEPARWRETSMRRRGFDGP
jgi:hypothetical protein